jgi:membrane protein implicated in regulation of membrane protease activity
MDMFALPDWSIWGLVAVILLIGEMLTTAYVALGFAVAAGLMAALVFVLPGLPVVVQAFIWAALGLAVWLALSRFSRRKSDRKDINDYDPRDSLPPSDRGGSTD